MPRKYNKKVEVVAEVIIDNTSIATCSCGAVYRGKQCPLCNKLR